MSDPSPIDPERLALARKCTGSVGWLRRLLADVLADRDYQEQRLVEVSESLRAWIARANDVENEAAALRREVVRLRARVRVEAEDVERAGVTRAQVEAWLRMSPRWESSTNGAWHWKPANGGVFTTLSDGKRSDELADDVHWLAKREQRSGLDILEEMAATTPPAPARGS